MWYNLSGLSRSWNLRFSGFFWPGVVPMSDIARWFRDGADPNVQIDQLPTLYKTWPDGKQMWQHAARIYQGGARPWRYVVVGWTCCDGNIANMANDLLSQEQPLYAQGELRDQQGRVVV